MIKKNVFKIKITAIHITIMGEIDTHIYFAVRIK